MSAKRPAIKLQKWTIGDAVRLDADMVTHLGRLHADDPSEVVKLEFGRRVLVRFAAGDVWADQERLLPAQRTMEGLQ